MATPDEAVKILNKLSDELQARRTDVQTLEDAYRGKHRLFYSTESFRKYHGDNFKDFCDNWCQVIADAPHERLGITGIRLKGAEKGDEELWDEWRRNDADAYSDLSFLDAIIAKRSYALVWGTEDNEARITWEHPSQAIVGYDPETRQRRAGAKMWADDTLEYATLYLPDEVWKFQRTRMADDRQMTESGLYLPGYAGGWTPRDEEVIPNPLGIVPLVEFPNRPRLIGEPISDIEAALPLQRAINYSWANQFVTEEYMARPQRGIVGAERPMTPVRDSEGNIVGEKAVDLDKWAADKALWVEDPAAKPFEWKGHPADMTIVKTAIQHLAAQTRTPAHYLIIDGGVSNVSGDALKALETGLVQRTKEKTEHFGRAAREVFRLVALVQGDEAKAEAVRAGEVLWKDVENRSDAQLADALQKKRAMGYPLRYLLELEGLPPSEIDRVMTMAESEASDPILNQLAREIASPSADTAPEAEEPNAPVGA